jgi:hypothetical protein
LTKAHNAANEQATLNAPTERTVVQRPNEEGTGMLDIFIVVFDAVGSIKRELYLFLWQRRSGKVTKLNGSVQAQDSRLRGAYLRHRCFSSAKLFKKPKPVLGLKLLCIT